MRDRNVCCPYCARGYVDVTWDPDDLPTLRTHMWRFYCAGCGLKMMALGATREQALETWETMFDTPSPALAAALATAMER